MSNRLHKASRTNATKAFKEKFLDSVAAPKKKQEKQPKKLQDEIKAHNAKVMKAFFSNQKPEPLTDIEKMNGLDFSNISLQ